MSFAEFCLLLETINAYPQHPNCIVLSWLMHDQLNKNVSPTSHTERTEFCSNMEDGHLNASSLSK